MLGGLGANRQGGGVQNEKGRAAWAPVLARTGEPAKGADQAAGGSIWTIPTPDLGGGVRPGVCGGGAAGARVVERTRGWMATVEHHAGRRCAPPPPRIPMSRAPAAAMRGIPGPSCRIPARVPRLLACGGDGRQRPCRSGEEGSRHTQGGRGFGRGWPAAAAMPCRPHVSFPMAALTRPIFKKSLMRSNTGRGSRGTGRQAADVDFILPISTIAPFYDGIHCVIVDTVTDGLPVLELKPFDEDCTDRGDVTEESISQTHTFFAGYNVSIGNGSAKRK